MLNEEDGSNGLELFYKKTYDLWRDCTKFSWNIIQFYTITGSAFISLTLGIISIIITNETILNLPRIYPALVLWLSSILPLFMLIILWIGKKNFFREAKHIAEQLATLIKLEQKLG